MYQRFIIRSMADALKDMPAIYTLLKIEADKSGNIEQEYKPGIILPDINKKRLASATFF